MQAPQVIQVNQQNFHEVIQSSATTPILFYFWAPMSQESEELLPHIQQLAQKYAGAVQLAMLNCQEEQTIAGQFGIQALPTIAMFVNGQPVDGLAGPQPLDAIEAMLTRHLPSQDERDAKQALQFVQDNQHAQALGLLQALSEEWQQRGDIKLAMADCFLESGQFEQAATLLSAIPLEYQDNYYTGLCAKLELHQNAANSPELQALEDSYAHNLQDAELANKLATSYHEVARDEEALQLLWSFLQKDLNALEGDLKKTFMDILSALGQGNPLASRYRRLLYSRLY